MKKLLLIMVLCLVVAVVAVPYPSYGRGGHGGGHGGGGHGGDILKRYRLPLKKALVRPTGISPALFDGW